MGGALCDNSIYMQATCKARQVIYIICFSIGYIIDLKSHAEVQALLLVCLLCTLSYIARALTMRNLLCVDAHMVHV